MANKASLLSFFCFPNAFGPSGSPEEVGLCPLVCLGILLRPKKGCGSKGVCLTHPRSYSQPVGIKRLSPKADLEHGELGSPRMPNSPTSPALWV